MCSRRFGICLAECSSGEFWLGQFDDDSNYTQVLVLLSGLVLVRTF